MFTITYALALFTLLAVSSGVYFLSQKLRLPYTVLLVAVGVFVLVPLSRVPFFSFIDDFTLTPALLFYLFLPVLIFEAAYNIRIRRLMENISSISLLAVGSLLVSAALIGALLSFGLALIGLPIPFEVALLFGALISATDPVAVLALFKEFGAPQRLSLIFEGESIFNDGTAVALFLIILGIIEQGGFSGASSVLEGIGMFCTMIAGGILMGLIMGGGFAKIVGYARHNEFVSITLTIALAHLTFITTELLSETLVIGNFPVHLSAIIATTVASMVMGNYGRSKISPKAEEFVEKFWGQFAFLVNSLVFILIGLIIAHLPFSFKEFLLPALLAVLIVAISRAVSIYPIIELFNRTGIEARIPRAWQHLLAWGSLRGALAVMMVLLIPPDLTLPSWAYSYSVRDFLLALTINCIFATLFIKAPTIRPLMHKLGIDSLTDMERLELASARALVYTQALLRLNDFAAKGYVEKHAHARLAAEHEYKLERAMQNVPHGANSALLADRILRLHAIGIERHYLKELFTYEEVSERVYKRILGKLAIQYERIEGGNLEEGDLSAYRDAKDVFEHLADMLRHVLVPRSRTISAEERYMYYRAQCIIARKVLKEFKRLESLSGRLFDHEKLERTIAIYEAFRATTAQKMEQVVKDEPGGIDALSERLARRGILKVEEDALEELNERSMVTPKVYVTLHQEVEHSSYNVT